MDMLGWSVALSGNTGLVGEFPQSGDQGGAYVFTRSGTTWRQQGGALTADDGVANDWFGWSVALDGETALIGAWGHNGIQGAAYVVSPPTITPSVAAGKGTISPGAPQTVSYGATPTFTFAPAAGYQVGTVSVDGGRVSLTGADRYTFPAVSADHTLSVVFTVAPKPVLLKVSPTAGLVGSVVTLTGREFGAARGAGVVTFGAKKVSKYVRWSATKIEVKVPAGTPKGSVKVRVTTAGGSSAAKWYRRR